MDAFFASVELKDAPDLAGKPVVVGGAPEARGVVAAASYEARRFAIHSAMPMARAVRLCPDLIIRPPRFDRYEEESHAIRELLERYTPLVEPLSLDEAFLDVTGSQRLYGGAPEIGRRIREGIGRERRLSASVGVAGCKFVAKLASDLRKPGGFVVVEPGTEEEFLRPLPVGRMWGVGPVTEQALHRLGIRTIGDLQALQPQTLRDDLGSLADRLIHLAHGEDDSPVELPGQAKSLSAENTFARDLTDQEELERELLALAERVAERLRAEELSCRTVTLKVRSANFRTITRSLTLGEPTHATEELYTVARTLLREKVSRRPHRAGGHPQAVRLLGIGASHLLRQAVRQLDLFTVEAGESPASARVDRLEHVVDEVRQRLGTESLRRASLLTGTHRRRPPAAGQSAPPPEEEDSPRKTER
jgi:DNA polymerase-4